MIASIKRASDIFKIEPELIRAIIEAESSGNQYAIRYEPKFFRWLTNRFKVMRKKVSVTEMVGRSMSWGPMQVMGQVARELGYKRDFPMLCEEWVGIFYGTKHLYNKISKYGHLEGISAYNQGSPRRKRNGEFKNQYYVDKVIRYYEHYKKYGYE